MAKLNKQQLYKRAYEWQKLKNIIDVKEKEMEAQMKETDKLRAINKSLRKKLAEARSLNESAVLPLQRVICCHSHLPRIETKKNKKLRNIISILKKMFFKEKKKRKNILEPIDFKKGMVVKMKPGYYTIKSYYVLIKEVTETGIITTIPGGHDLKLDKIKDKATWNHQVSRMTIVGDKESHGHLLINQFII